MRNVLLTLTSLFWLALPGAVHAQGPSVVLLSDSRGHVHDVVKPTDGDSLVKRTLQSIVEKTLDGTFAHIADAASLGAEQLDPAKTRVLVMYTTGNLPMDLDLLNRYVENGGTLLGIHCATDTFKEDARYFNLIGGTFAEHPWDESAPVILKSIDREHAAGAPIGRQRAIREEIYVHTNFDPAKVRVLVVLDMEQTMLKRPGAVPVVWVKQVGKGRVLYTSLGHNDAVWRSDWYRQHLTQSIKWLIGDAKGDVEPNPQAFRREEALARQAFEKAGGNEKAQGQQDVVNFHRDRNPSFGAHTPPLHRQDIAHHPPSYSREGTIMAVHTQSLLLASVLAGTSLWVAEPHEPPADPERAAHRQSESGFIPLLDGTAEGAAKHWRGFKKEDLPDGWAVEDKTLTLKKSGGGDLVTREKFTDFELRLEWRVEPGGNSGIFYRVVEEGEGTEATYSSGLEMQILDDARHPDGKSTMTSAGSLYGLYAVPEPSPVKPAGEWNEARIVHRGDHVEHWLNGVNVADAEIGSEDWKARLAKSKFKDWPLFAKKRTGRIGLQDHGDPVWFRNIRVKRLDDSKAVPANPGR